ncbi:unnamed protein product [Orchesella dallaii]|uniref:C2H2-type domain-containing protein n=1 Tax=Orchesella dallaii TaxID=48710 RepID=A0ABP1QNI7_9HEXA
MGNKILNGKMSMKRNWSDSNGTNGTQVEDELARSDARVGNLSLILDLYQSGSQKDKKLLTEECNGILECRVCLNLFRKVDDFRRHKNSFCKEDFNAVGKGGVSYAIDFTRNGNAQTRTEVQFYDELIACLKPADKKVIQVRVKPFLKLVDGTTICHQYVDTGSDSAQAEEDFLNQYKSYKKDTVVLDINGKIIKQGTQLQCASTAAKVSRKIELMKDEGRFISSPPVAIKTHMCQICKRNFKQRKGLVTHEKSCRKKHMSIRPSQQLENMSPCSSPSTCNTSLNSSRTSNSTWTPNLTSTPNRSKTRNLTWTSPTTPRTPTSAGTPNTSSRAPNTSKASDEDEIVLNEIEAANVLFSIHQRVTNTSRAPNLASTPYTSWRTTNTSGTSDEEKEVFDDWALN